jgi:hypothetical protein
MRRAGLQAVAATISLLILVGLGSAQETASAPALMDAQSTTTSTDTSKQSLAMTADGRVHVDVVVRDGADKLVPGLQAKDFKLLDDGKERSVASFAAFDGIKAKPDPPVQMILVVDCVNNGFVELDYIRQGLTRFPASEPGAPVAADDDRSLRGIGSGDSVQAIHRWECAGRRCGQNRSSHQAGRAGIFLP